MFHKRKDRHRYLLSDFGPKLLVKVRIYAAAKGISICKAFEQLVTIGLINHPKYPTKNPQHEDFDVIVKPKSREEVKK